MLHPLHGGFDSVHAFWEGRSLGVVQPVDRPDLAEPLYWVRHPERAGVQIDVPLLDADGRLELVGHIKRRPAARLTTHFIAPHLDTLPIPPDPLATRVSDLAGDAFRLSGQKAFTDLWDELTPDTSVDPRELTVLDWGCGCGRVSRYLARAGVGRLHGCDIDPEAIAWCATHLPGEFHLTATEPSLPFGSAELDVVIATSVFTHLARDEQEGWLAELHRVLRPNGILLASLAGAQAARLGRSPRLASLPAGSPLTRLAALRRTTRLARAGIIDQQLDPHLDGIAPAGYYRYVYQTARYTKRAWQPYFQLLSHIPRGLNGHQDLVVMQRLEAFRD